MSDTWGGIKTIKDIWFILMLDKIIDREEYDRVTKLTLSDQQKELEKYQALRKDHLPRAK